MNGIDYNQPETRAAWQMEERSQIHGFTVVQVVELILTATLSPWFSQLQTLAADENPALREGARTLVTILNSGYSATARTWFYLPALFPTAEALALAHYNLANFFRVLQQSRLTGKHVSPIVDAFGELLFGRDQLPIVTELAAIGQESFTMVFQVALKHRDSTREGSKRHREAVDWNVPTSSMAVVRLVHN
jgi:hypothetical protein